jgi:L,D-transpeptidase YbiS
MILRATLAALLLVAAVVLGTGYDVHGLEETLSSAAPDSVSLDRRKLEARERELRAKYDRLKPSGVHVVIDQTHNRLLLKDKDRVVREAVCSGGSGMVLQEHDGSRSWVFDTPRGVFQVRSKIVNPLWRKPDWAFVEEGLPIPKNPEERFERGTLGEYALAFGDGYLIHGTLYTRLLGRSVTHGCIRLGRDDLREVYKTAAIGTPVYIF